jgi:glycosyltransferase involved in cell wall biosynthesis
MSAGLPVIVTEMVGVSELLTDGHDCLKVKAGEPEALADAIDRLLQDKSLRETLSRNGVRTASEWSEDRMAREYASLFEKARGN